MFCCILSVLNTLSILSHVLHSDILIFCADDSFYLEYSLSFHMNALGSVMLSPCTYCLCSIIYFVLSYTLSFIFPSLFYHTVSYSLFQQILSVLSQALSLFRHTLNLLPHSLCSDPLSAFCYTLSVQTHSQRSLTLSLFRHTFNVQTHSQHSPAFSLFRLTLNVLLHSPC